MLHEVPTLEHLLKKLQQVPYLASKNLYRVATYFLAMEEQKVEQFCTALRELQLKLKRCDVCFWWQEKARTCFFCSSPKRDQSLVCVVESWDEVLAVEKAQGYQGVSHILGGVIFPLEGIGPEHLTIAALFKRINTHGIKEIILATNQTPEGEATAAYIARQLKETSVTISCLARGLPVGSILGAMDSLTTYKALSERRPF